MHNKLISSSFKSVKIGINYFVSGTNKVHFCERTKRKVIKFPTNILETNGCQPKIKLSASVE